MQKNLRAAFELTVVGGSSLLAIFWIIPAQTVAGDNFGLSPTMVPIVCAAAIGGLSVLQFVVGLFNTINRPSSENGFGTAGLIIVSALLGTAVVGEYGLIIGGMSIVGLLSLSIGVRDWKKLSFMVIAAGALMYFVKISGL